MTPPGRRVDEGRVAELVTQATDIVLAEGFATLSMDALAARLRCSKSTLYAAVGTKRDLVESVVRRVFAAATRRVEDVTAAEDDNRGKIKTYLYAVGAEMGRYSPAFYRDVVDYPPTAEIYRLNSDAAARRVREIIAAGVAAGQFRPVDAAFASELIVLAVDAVQRGQITERTGLTASEGFAETANLLLDGLQYSSPVESSGPPASGTRGARGGRRRVSES
jgi:AcrR family transcriptional regulator